MFVLSQGKADNWNKRACKYVVSSIDIIARVQYEHILARYELDLAGVFFVASRSKTKTWIVSNRLMESSLQLAAG